MSRRGRRRGFGRRLATAISRPKPNLIVDGAQGDRTRPTTQQVA